jgi:hypothetical protein
VPSGEELVAEKPGAFEDVVRLTIPIAAAATPRVIHDAALTFGWATVRSGRPTDEVMARSLPAS